MAQTFFSILIISQLRTHFKEIIIDVYIRNELFLTLPTPPTQAIPAPNSRPSRLIQRQHFIQEGFSIGRPTTDLRWKDPLGQIPLR